MLRFEHALEADCTRWSAEWLFDNRLEMVGAAWLAGALYLHLAYLIRQIHGVYPTQSPCQAAAVVHESG